jgi:hypothetical protein
MGPQGSTSAPAKFDRALFILMGSVHLTHGLPGGRRRAAFPSAGRSIRWRGRRQRRSGPACSSLVGPGGRRRSAWRRLWKASGTFPGGCNALISWQNRRATLAGNCRKGRGEIRWTATPGGHFYLAEKGTFLLGPDIYSEPALRWRRSKMALETTTDNKERDNDDGRRSLWSEAG